MVSATSSKKEEQKFQNASKSHQGMMMMKGVQGLMFEQGKNGALQMVPSASRRVD